MPTRTLIVERDVEMTARDGVTLRADIYRPSAGGPFPVLLQRTPYGKGGTGVFALLAAERGYAVVVQDTRGRWASDGDGTPFVWEKADGADAVQWAAAQPWADGNVGMWGASYVGYTQLAAASQRPPALKTIIPTVTFCDGYDLTYHGGAFAAGLVASWGIGAVASMAVQRLPDSDPRKPALLAELIRQIDGLAGRGATFRTLRSRRSPSLARTASAPSSGSHSPTPCAAIRTGRGSALRPRASASRCSTSAAGTTSLPPTPCTTTPRHAPPATRASVC